MVFSLFLFHNPHHHCRSQSMSHILLRALYKCLPASYHLLLSRAHTHTYIQQNFYIPFYIQFILLCVHGKRPSLVVSNAKKGKKDWILNSWFFNDLLPGYHTHTVVTQQIAGALFIFFLFHSFFFQWFPCVRRIFDLLRTKTLIQTEYSMVTKWKDKLKPSKKWNAIRAYFFSHYVQITFIF